ncbi:amidase family protein [Actinocrispum wychmicini]|uniref:amidase family protein n=1 Tax=Actinocrispum wychmicini TaxID=1213861 RepID=UPI001FB7EE79|nr:amidase family protein [Actinocrispum wychmicini]
MVTLDERAASAAWAADEAVARGEPVGPLHGVAMTVKDSLSTAGLRTTGGTPDLATHVPDEDAPVVAALRHAGAIIFGKTNMPEYAADVQTGGALFGLARNPWHPDYTTGGSSGGSAGAVAAGFTPVELGSDVAGSIRIPAANCGVLGHKPSFGIVSMHGHVPPFPHKHATPDMSVVGPIARTARDVEIVLDVVAGPHPFDRPAWHLTLPKSRPLRRVAAWFDAPYCPVDAEVRNALATAAAALVADGISVDVGSAAELGLDIDLARNDEVFRRLLTAVASGGYSDALIEDIAVGRRPVSAELGAEYVAQRHRHWLVANEQRAQFRLRWQEFFAKYDAILLPVTPNPVSEHDSRPFEDRTIVVNGVPRPYWDQIVWSGLASVSYLPSTAVPVGLDTRGLPLGIAVVGPYLADRTTLALAGRLADLLPPLTA